MDLNLLSTTTLPSNIKNVPIIDLRGRIPANPKYTWEQLKGARKVTALTRIVFHHDALSKASTAAYSDEVLIQRIATSHINSTKNLPGGDNFPYHAFIRNGKLYICNNLTDFTYGVSSNNSDTVHISVSGNYAANDVLVDADRTALYAAYYLYKANMPSYKELLGHKDLAATACPGYSMTKVKTDIADIDLSASLSNGLNDQLAKAFATQVRIKDLYDKASVPNKNQEAAIKKLARINEWMASQGLL